MGYTVKVTNAKSLSVVKTYKSDLNAIYYSKMWIRALQADKTFKGSRWQVEVFYSTAESTAPVRIHCWKEA
jgi:hypothetical protein